jgi:hypothetical protein
MKRRYWVLLLPVLALASLCGFNSVLLLIPALSNSQDLNDAYIRLVNNERHRVDPCVPWARYNPNLLAGTVAFSQFLESRDTLCHDSTPYAEMVGTLNDAPQAPAQLARFIFERLRASPPHCRIQSDAGLTGICLSATSRYYVVRLSRTPSTPCPRR